MNNADGSIWFSVGFNVSYECHITHNSVAIVLCRKFIRAFLSIGKFFSVSSDYRIIAPLVTWLIKSRSYIGRTFA